MLPDGTLAKVIENTLYMSPTLTTQTPKNCHAPVGGIHEYISRNHLGEVFTAPFDVFLMVRQMLFSRILYS